MGQKKRPGPSKQLGGRLRGSGLSEDAGDTSLSTGSEFTDSEWVESHVRVKEHPPLGAGVDVKDERKRKKGPEALSQGVGVESADVGPLPKKRRLLSPGLGLKAEPNLLHSGPTPSDLTFSPLTPDRPKKKRIPYTLVEASKGNRCPTEGCDGHGHITGMYEMHFAVSGCPKAHGKTAEECRARREELNRLRTKNMSHEGEEPSSIRGVVLGERSLRRTQRSSVEDIVSGRGSVASLSMSRKMQSQVSGHVTAPKVSTSYALNHSIQRPLPLGASPPPSWHVSLSCMDCSSVQSPWAA